MDVKKLSYRIPDAVKATGFCRTQIYQFMKEGRLKYKKAGKSTIFTHEYLQDLINSLPEGGKKSS